MDVMQFWGLAGVPVIAGVVQALKGYIPDKRAWPILSLVFGVALNAGIAVNTGGNMVLGVLLGIVSGLAACGIWSGPKNALGK